MLVVVFFLLVTSFPATYLGHQGQVPADFRPSSGSLSWVVPDKPRDRPPDKPRGLLPMLARCVSSEHGFASHKEKLALAQRIYGCVTHLEYMERPPGIEPALLA